MKNAVIGSKSFLQPIKIKEKSCKTELFRLYKQLPVLKRLLHSKTAEGKYRICLLLQIRVNLFSRLCLKSSLGKQNQQSSRVMGNFLFYT